MGFTRNLLHLLLFGLALSSFTWAQGSTVQVQVQNTQGQAIAGATVSVCSASPITPLCGGSYASIFTDLTLVTPINQATTPLITNGYGTVQVYAAPGLVWVQTSGARTLTNVYPVTIPAYVGGGTSVALQVNSVNNVNQGLLNLINTPTFTFNDNGSGAVSGAVNQSAAYTWTGIHNFGNNTYFKGPSPWLSFKGFGAVGDGVTDDTAAIQAALNAATTLQSVSPTNVGLDMFCDPGVYNISKPLVSTAKVLGIMGPGSVNGNQNGSGCLIRSVGSIGWLWTNSSVTSTSVTSGTAGCPGSDQCTLVTVTTSTNCCGTGQSIQVPMDVQVEGTDQSPSGGSVAVRSAYEGYHQVVATPASNQYQYFIGFSNATGISNASSVGTTRVMMLTAGSTTPYVGPTNIGSLTTHNVGMQDCTASTTTANSCPASTANATTFTGISLTKTNGQVLTGLSGLAVNGYVGADASIGGESHQITSNTATTVTVAQSYVNLCDAGILSVTRATNVVTAATYYTSVVCNVGDSVVVSAVPVGTNTFNGTFTITGITGSLFTWSQTGANESAIGGFMAKTYTGVKLFNARQSAGGLALNNANFCEQDNFTANNFERGTGLLLAGLPPTFAANKVNIGTSQGVWAQWCKIHHPSIWNSRYTIVTSENMSALAVDGGILQCNSGNTPPDYSVGIDWGGLSPNFHGGENYIWGTSINSCAIGIGLFSNGINEIHAKTENDGNLSNYTVLDYPLTAGGVVYTSGATVTGFSGLPPNGLRRFPLVLYRSGTVSTTMGNPVINLVTTTPAGTAFDIGMTGNKIIINDGGVDHAYIVLTYNSPTQLTLTANAGNTSAGTLYTYYDFNDTYTIQSNTATVVTLATTPSLTAGNYGAKIPSTGVVMEGDPTYGLTGNPQTTISRRNKLDINSVAPGLGIFVGPNASDTKVAQSVSGCSDLLICAARQIAPSQINTTEVMGDASGTLNQVANYQPDNDMIQALNVGAFVFGTGANNAGALNLVYPVIIPVVAATPGVNHTDAAGNTYTDTSTGVSLPSGLSSWALQRTFAIGNCLNSFTVTTGVLGTGNCVANTEPAYQGPVAATAVLPNGSFTILASGAGQACFGGNAFCTTAQRIPSRAVQQGIIVEAHINCPVAVCSGVEAKTFRWDFTDNATHCYVTYSSTTLATQDYITLRVKIHNTSATNTQKMIGEVGWWGTSGISIPFANNVTACTLDWTASTLAVALEGQGDATQGTRISLVDFSVYSLQ